MRIALDAMGGDSAPAIPVLGAVEALQQNEGDFELLIVGDADAIERELDSFYVPRGRVQIVPATETIADDEPPVDAVRHKPDSSIVRAVQLQSEGEADALVSAGSTGATLAASMLFLGPLPGTDRPAIGALLPAATAGPTLLIDVGANADCSPKQLLQFAHLGHVYVKDLQGRLEPRIGLLNIGGEAGKGDHVSQEAYRLLERSGLNFVGNVEGRAILAGNCDVIVCGGFVGNVVLKFYESVAGHVARLLSEAVAGAEALVDLQSLCGVLDYAEHGGAPLLGVDGVTVICHGDSPARAIRNALKVAAKAVENDMVEHLRCELTGLASARA